MAIEVGQKLTATVTGIKKFGAFVDLGDDKSGLVHISEISNDYVKDIHDILEVGQKVDVLVTNIAEDGKIALSMKKLEEPTKRSTETVHRPSHQSAPKHSKQSTQDFDAMMNAFLKDSDARLTSLKCNTEGKRGGRGGRRN